MKITALTLALALGLGLTAAYAQAPAKPAAVKVDCSKVENKGHAPGFFVSGPEVAWRR